MATGDPLGECVGFDWDESNTVKNWERHKVTPEEAEDVFFHEPLVVRGDAGHSTREKRYRALGRTSRGRLLCRLHDPAQVDPSDLGARYESKGS
jgi:hypothetical protein